MAEVMYGLVSEARKNRFSAIPKLTEEGKLIKKSRTQMIESLLCLFPFLAYTVWLSFVFSMSNVHCCSRYRECLGQRF